MSLVGSWPDDPYTAVAVIADSTSLRFLQRTVDGSGLTTVVELNKVLFVEGEQANVCIVLDIPSLTYIVSEKTSTIL